MLRRPLPHTLFLIKARELRKHIYIYIYSADPLRKRLWKRIYIFWGLVCRVLEQCSADPLRIPSAYPVFSFFWPGVPESTSGAPQTPLRGPPPWSNNFGTGYRQPPIWSLYEQYS